MLISTKKCEKKKQHEKVKRHIHYNANQSNFNNYTRYLYNIIITS